MNILEITKKFSTQKKCLDHLEKVRWGGEIKCVYCGCNKVCKHTEKNKEAQILLSLPRIKPLKIASDLASKIHTRKSLSQFLQQFLVLLLPTILINWRVSV